MSAIIERDYYLNQLIARKNNGLIKVITGIRRCGKSFLLRTLFKQHLLDAGVRADHIIEMSFDLFENIDYRDPRCFYPWVTEQIGAADDNKGSNSSTGDDNNGDANKDSSTTSDTYYILLDEVQLLGEFVSVLNALADKKNCDVYVTGSNARFLSRDIVTEFGGRADEIHMYPLSFAEFMSVYDGHYYNGWNEYITYGGIPLVVLAPSTEQKAALLHSLLQETYLRDIIERNKVRNSSEIDTLLNFLASSIGALTNPHKLENTFASVLHSSISSATINKYISYFEDSFLIEKAQRYDIKGKAYIGTPMKYYFTDLGLRNSQLNFRQMEVSHLMENAVYTELKKRGYQVDVGNLTVSERSNDNRQVKKQLEVDFVCNKGSLRYYIQSAYLMETAEKQEQESRSLLTIDDNFRKIIITSNTPQPHYNEHGILVMSIYDFLLQPEAMDL